MSKSKQINQWKGMAVLVVALGLTACADASAFGSARSPDESAAPAPAPAPVVSTGDLSVDDGNEGYRLGLRNGGILVNRLKLATVGKYGCTAIGELEASLLKVARKIKAPSYGAEALTIGFFQGYLDAIRDGVWETRLGCDAVAFEDDGWFAGSLYGSLLCSVTSVSLELASQLELVSLYDGWAGGSTEVISGCRTSLELTLRECSGLEDVSSLELAIQSSCSE